ncbi:MAG: ABC transporter substrate-binding protein [bacterium]
MKYQITSSKLQTIPKLQFINFNIVICLLFVIWILGFTALAETKAYDGVWFLGFNVKRPPFNQLAVRQAVAHSIDKDYIASKIIGDEQIPAGFIPPGMLGSDPTLKPYKTNLAFAKKLIKKAKLTNKKISLLHTDGVKTLEIAKKISSDLKALGFTVTLVQVSFRDEKKWAELLASKNYPLFLMGYKADETEGTPDTATLLGPLFKSRGDANFSGYGYAKTDKLFSQISLVPLSSAKEREMTLKKIGQILYRDLPGLVLFYIEKL